MTMTSGARSRLRDSSDDVETRVFPRPPPFTLDRAMVQRIMSELPPSARAPAALAARPIATRRQPSRPNVFLTPWSGEKAPALPWADPLAASGERPRVRVIRRRSLMPWAAFAMTFAITFGVVKDPALRVQTANQIKGAAAAMSVGARSSALRLWTLASHVRG